MKYDEIQEDGHETLEEIWSGLSKWLERFLPGTDREMFGSTAEMNRYISYWVSQLRKLAARYRDENGDPIKRNTLGRLPLPVVKLFMSKLMRLPDAEIDGILDQYNRHPLTIKSNLSLKSPLTVDSMSSSLDDGGQPNTILNYFKKNSASGRSAIDVGRFIDTLVAAAATRKMEIDHLGDTQSRMRDQAMPKPQDPTADSEDGPRKDDDEIVARISALSSAIDQLIKLQESIDPGGEWSGGLSEGMMSTLAMIAESKPDVYSIVKRAYSQGHDADTIKQMLKSLQYPTNEVDGIISKLAAKRQGTSIVPKIPAPGAKKQGGKKQGTIYVDKSGKATYDRPAPPKSASVKTGNAYVDGVINDTLARHGKMAALRAAVTLLQRYQAKLDGSERRHRGRHGQSDVVADAMKTLINVNRWLQGQKSGKRK